MAAFREPRRVARQHWQVETHLGELDSDIDELHLLRGQDKQAHAEDLKRLELRIGKLTAAAWGAAATGATMAAGLVANIILKTF